MPFNLISNFFKHHKNTKDEKINNSEETSKKTYVICFSNNLKKHNIGKKFTKDLIFCPEHFRIKSAPPAFTLLPMPPKGVKINQKDILKKLKRRYVAVFDMSMYDMKKTLSVEHVNYIGKRFVFQDEIKPNTKELHRKLLDVYLELLNPENNKWMRVKNYKFNKPKRAEHLPTAEIERKTLAL